MPKLKLMSVLQSRIAKRRSSISNFWEAYHQDNSQGLNLDTFKKVAINTGRVQKEDKQILKRLVEDERELKLLRECAKKLQGRIDTLLGWNK